jgi:hypothetical protein
MTPAAPADGGMLTLVVRVGTAHRLPQWAGSAYIGVEIGNDYARSTDLCVGPTSGGDWQALACPLPAEEVPHSHLTIHTLLCSTSRGEQPVGSITLSLAQLHELGVMRLVAPLEVPLEVQLEASG